MRVATQALEAAEQASVSVVDRQVRQPDTWLMRRCCQVLAERGTAEATFAAVELIRAREPLAPYRVLPILARRAVDDVELALAVSQRLQALRFYLHRPIPTDPVHWGEQLLFIACAAAHIDDDVFAFACLERFDQARGLWPDCFNQPERREILAETVALVGLHPLTSQLIRQSVHHYAEAGAHFLQLVALRAGAQIELGRRVQRSRRLLQRCVETFQYATLTSLLSRRYAATVFGLSGNVDAILEQVATLANIQEARRESGIAYREAGQKVLRQVKRPRANADVDFQFYTLKDAADWLDLTQLDPSHRTVLAERLATLGIGSDGWTAAAATAALLRLGEIEHAIAVVDRIDARDPTRSEAFRVLVAGLLASGEAEEARVQTQKAIAWAQSLPEHHPERLTIWGIAEAYLAHNQAQIALDVLDQRRPPDLRVRLRRLFSKTPAEEHLREQALRMHTALLQTGARDRATAYLATIRRQAPQALDGKALALFYTEHVLAPLLASGHHTLAWSFLQDVQAVLGRIFSREQPARVEAVARLLVHELNALDRSMPQPGADGAIAPQNAPLDAARTAAGDLLVHLWKGSAQQGIWPTVYSIGGALPLVIALAGSEVVVEIARFAATEGDAWRKPFITGNAEPEEILQS